MSEWASDAKLIPEGGMSKLQTGVGIVVLWLLPARRPNAPLDYFRMVLAVALLLSSALGPNALSLNITPSRNTFLLKISSGANPFVLKIFVGGEAFLLKVSLCVNPLC